MRAQTIITTRVLLTINRSRDSKEGILSDMNPESFLSDFRGSCHFESPFLCAQSGSFFIGGYDELFWATEQSIVQLVNHNKRVV